MADRRTSDPRICFDPRPREGGDLESVRQTWHERRFDPRPREGGDAAAVSLAFSTEVVSIHAPAKGATARQAAMRARHDSFDPRPREGGDRLTTPCAAPWRRFDPRPREGGDDRGIALSGARGDVSIHAPAKGATVALRSTRHLARVSIHAPAKGATVAECESIAVDDVSIHAPAKGATADGLQPRAGEQRFDPRPREGGDARRFRGLIWGLWVSIHAPAKGATLDLVRLASAVPVSIHAPAKGATAVGVDQVAHARVSIHAPAKGATGPHPARGGLGGVSIHAPAKGATALRSCGCIAISGFDPRPREGGDLDPSRADELEQLFRSTPPRRGRRSTAPVIPSPDVFRSTPPRRGRRARQVQYRSVFMVSIHAPAKGATRAAARP